MLDRLRGGVRCVANHGPAVYTGRNRMWHRTKSPILSRTKCQSCGSLGHGDWNVRKCPVLALRVGLGCEDPKLLETYPCLFCDNPGHTTRMCRVMHSPCRNFGHRGHVGTDHRLSDFGNFLQSLREEFHRYQHLGICARRAQGREGNHIAGGSVLHSKERG